MDSLIVILIAALILINLCIFYYLIKNRREKQSNTEQTFKDEFNNFKETFTQSFGHMSKDIAKDMSGALIRVDEKVGIFSKSSFF